MRTHFGGWWRARPRDEEIHDYAFVSDRDVWGWLARAAAVAGAAVLLGLEAWRLAG